MAAHPRGNLISLLVALRSGALPGPSRRRLAQAGAWAGSGRSSNQACSKGLTQGSWAGRSPVMEMSVLHRQPTYVQCGAPSHPAAPELARPSDQRQPRTCHHRGLLVVAVRATCPRNTSRGADSEVMCTTAGAARLVELDALQLDLGDIDADGHACLRCAGASRTCASSAGRASGSGSSGRPEAPRARPGPPPGRLRQPPPPPASAPLRRTVPARPSAPDRPIASPWQGPQASAAPRRAAPAGRDVEEGKFTA